MRHCSERNPAPLPVIVASVFKISGETFATDASVIEADARLARRTEGKEPPDDWDDPGKVTRPVREYLDQLDKAAGLGALPGESPQPPKSLSLTDPQAALTSKGRSKISFAYGTKKQGFALSAYRLIKTYPACVREFSPEPRPSAN
jgi:hypothetical protein